MAYSTVIKTRRDGKITLKDQGASNTLEISYEEGNLTMDGIQSQKSGQSVIRDRGVVVNVRKSDDEVSATGSFSAYFRQFADASEAGSLLDFINKTGNYSGNTSTGSTGSPFIEQYCIDIQYEVEGTDFGDDADHSVTMSKCICTVSFAESDAGSTFTINFTCYGGLAFSGPS